MPTDHPGRRGRDSDGVRAPTAAERADERGRVARVTKPCLGPWERASGQADTLNVVIVSKTDWLLYFISLLFICSLDYFIRQVARRDAARPD